MDKTTFREMILADFIKMVEDWPREKLFNEIIELKHSELERLTDSELIQKIKNQKIINH